MLELSRAEQLRNAVRLGWAPPTTLTVSQFADQELVVTSGPMAGTSWQTDTAPYQRGILDVFHEVGVQIAVVMGSSQWGKTACAVCLAAFHMVHDPCDILVVEPTVKPMAEDFAKNRLDPVIKASPALQAVVGKKRQKDATNTVLQKTFEGGFIAIGGANSAASLAARAVRLLILDEIDRYGASLKNEGSTMAVAMKRTTTYRHRRRILMLSSPTVRRGNIHRWWEAGDRRRFHVPCPACGVLHPFMWKQVRWRDRDPLTARLMCPACEHPIDDVERIAILAQGEWRSDNPDRADKTIVSFHLWEAYSPFSSLADIVRSFLRAHDLQKGGDPTEMHTWQNTTLGEPTEVNDAGQGVEPDQLVARREPFAVEVPAGGVFLTMGIDTQDNRLEGVVIAWGVGEESWLVDRVVINADTSTPAPWQDLEQRIDRQYRHASGHLLPVLAVCIDSAGHRTTEVYEWVHKQEKRRTGVYCTIGRGSNVPLVSSPSPKRWGESERQVDLYTIGVDAAKTIWSTRLGLAEPGPGFVHLPAVDWCDVEFAKQITSEKLVLKWKEGIPFKVWKQQRARNEGLDCIVLALGALRLYRPSLEAMAANLQTWAPPAADQAQSVHPSPIPKPAPRSRRRGTMRYQR